VSVWFRTYSVTGRGWLLSGAGQLAPLRSPLPRRARASCRAAAAGRGCKKPPPCSFPRTGVQPFQQHRDASPRERGTSKENSVQRETPRGQQPMERGQTAEKHDAARGCTIHLRRGAPARHRLVPRSGQTPACPEGRRGTRRLLHTSGQGRSGKLGKTGHTEKRASPADTPGCKAQRSESFLLLLPRVSPAARLSCPGCWPAAGTTATDELWHGTRRTRAQAT